LARSALFGQIRCAHTAAVTRLRHAPERGQNNPRAPFLNKRLSILGDRKRLYYLAPSRGIESDRLGTHNAGFQFVYFCFELLVFGGEFL